MRYRSFFQFLMSPQGRGAFFKLALTAFALLGLIFVVMTISWSLAKYNRWVNSRADSCLQEIIPDCIFSANFDHYYRCALGTELRNAGSVSKKILPLFNAYGQNESASVRICSSVLQLQAGESGLNIERQLVIFSDTVSEEHGSIALLALGVMVSLFFFYIWLRWVFT